VPSPNVEVRPLQIQCNKYFRDKCDTCKKYSVKFYGGDSERLWKTLLHCDCCFQHRSAALQVHNSCKSVQNLRLHMRVVLDPYCIWRLHLNLDGKITSSSIHACNISGVYNIAHVQITKFTQRRNFSVLHAQKRVRLYYDRKVVSRWFLRTAIEKFVQHNHLSIFQTNVSATQLISPDCSRCIFTEFSKLQENDARYVQYCSHDWAPKWQPNILYRP
jgi:hypothetical protein